jgi:predicted dehydrogenase
MRTVNVAIIGTSFMGKAHSNAWLSVEKFFDVDIKPVMKVACDVDAVHVQAFADNWGWEETSTDWKEVVTRKDIDIVDVCVPTFLHKEIVIAAAENGKHIFCEKPAGRNFEEARDMYEAVNKAGVQHYLNHNYRRVPAVSFAKKMIEAGKFGRIFHWRGAYLQDWISNPSFPLTWHLRKEAAGAGPHNDLNSHSVDLARFLVGEISKVTAMLQNFITERPLPGADAGTFKSGSNEFSTEMGKVTVEDAAFMVVEFDHGALGSFETSRFANGRKNFNSFEIYGSKGSLAFNMERMNELEFLNLEDPVEEQGFRTIQTTDPNHPYLSAWWPPGHIIGYEHTFTHAVKDFLEALSSEKEISPNLYDGMRVMQVLEAGIRSSETGRHVKVSEIQ